MRVFMAVFARKSEIGSFPLMPYEVVGMRKEGGESGYVPNMRMNTHIPCHCACHSSCLLSSVPNEEGLWAHVATLTATRLVRRDI